MMLQNGFHAVLPSPSYGLLAVCQHGVGGVCARFPRPSSLLSTQSQVAESMAASSVTLLLLFQSVT